MLAKGQFLLKIDFFFSFVTSRGSFVYYMVIIEIPGHALVLPIPSYNSS